MIYAFPLLLLWSESAFVAAVVWALVSILLLYLIRSPAQDMLERFCISMAILLRAIAVALRHHGRRLAARNRGLLRLMAENDYARQAERQFRRISGRVDRDLGMYPALHRALREQIERIEEDHRNAADLPPEPPAWLDAIATLTCVETRSDPAIARILRDMQLTLEAACHDAGQEYRNANRHRHRLLRRMQPHVRQLAVRLERLERRLDDIATAAQAVDADMAMYQTLRAQQCGPVRGLGVALLTRSLGGIALLAIAGLAAILNHHLIAAPMNLLLNTAGNGWAPVSTLMLIELALGVFIAEAAELTRLFNLFGQLSDSLRRRLIWLSGSVLAALATLQAGLAWAAYAPAAAWPLSAIDRLAPAIATLLALLLPAVIALAAIPLAAVMRSAPILVGGLLAAAAQLAAAIARVAATVTAALPAPLVRLYDVWIFLPLWCEQTLRETRGEAPPELAPPRSRDGRKD